MPNKIASTPRAEPVPGAKPWHADTRSAPGAVHTRSIGSYVPRLTRKAFEKYGFSAAALLTDWAAVVGPDMARYTEPVRLRWSKQPGVWHETETTEVGRPGATLIVRVAAGRALDIQYRAGQIIDRINAYFGYRAVAELRIVQASLGEPMSNAAPRAVLRTRQRAGSGPAPPELAGIADTALRGALERMAHAIVMRKGG